MPWWRVANFGWLPILHGGGQEREIRSGTLDVAATAGFAAALEVARESVKEEQRVRDCVPLDQPVLAAVPSAVVYGPTSEHDRLPGIANIGFPGCSADAILMLLDSARDRLFHRCGVLGRGLTAEPCAACDGIQPRAMHARR